MRGCEGVRGEVRRRTRRRVRISGRARDAKRVHDRGRAGVLVALSWVGGRAGALRAWSGVQGCWRGVQGCWRAVAGGAGLMESTEATRRRLTCPRGQPCRICDPVQCGVRPSHEGGLREEKAAYQSERVHKGRKTRGAGNLKHQNQLNMNSPPGGVRRIKSIYLSIDFFARTSSETPSLDDDGVT